MVDQSRIHVLNGKDIMSGRKYVLYWMQASQRVGENPAFLHALEDGELPGKPLVVCSDSLQDSPMQEGSLLFMLGAEGCSRSLRDREGEVSPRL